ncbi:MAG: DEAD/DEAH box helicase [Hyphomonadaceae bacterium]|nr:DEAD/DEAH box helicase [Hyphomonadaceae bacterium]
MDTNHIIKVVAGIGINKLTKCLGNDRLSRLAELGIQMTPLNIARAAFQEQGFELFRRRDLRAAILNGLSPAQLNKICGPTQAPHDPDALAEFKWAKNNAAERFLSILGVKSEDVFAAPQEGTEYSIQTKIHKPLFDYQNSVRKQLNSFIGSNKRKRIIAHMPTGAGKTRTTMELVADFIRNRNESDPTLVVWMAHSAELCEQAVQAFMKIWSKLGSEDANIYRFWGGKGVADIDFSKPVFVVTSFQSCYSAIMAGKDEKFEKMARLKRECDLLIVDEAHMSTAPTYSLAIGFLCSSNTKLIGLTATPGKFLIGGNADEALKLAEFYQNNKITLGDEVTNGANPIEFLQNRGILSRVDRERLDTEVDVKLSKRAAETISNLLDIPKEVLAQLGGNAARTAKIAAATLRLAVEEKKPTIVFCPTKENATDLALLLHEKGCQAGAITGETPTMVRRKWIKDFKSGEVQVLTNFGVLTTGFDAPKIEAVIIARPTTSVVLYSQMVGRGLRGAYVGGTKTCTLVDVTDNISNMPQIPQAFTLFDHHFGAFK